MRGSHEGSQRQFDRRTWAILGLAIAVILAFSATVPSLYVALARSGFLGDRLPAGGGWVLLVGLSGLSALFCLYMVRQQLAINRLRGRLILDQMELEQSRGRLAELTSLFQLGNRLHMELPLDTILEITVQRVAATLNSNDATLFLYDSDAKLLRPRASVVVGSPGTEREVRLGQGAVGWAAQYREPVLMHAQEREARFADFFSTRPGLGSALVLPIALGEKTLAVLQVCRARYAEAFRLEHRDVGQLFAENVASVIDRALIVESLREATSAATTAVSGEPANGAGVRFRDSLLAIIADELKSPLTSIVAYSEVLDQNDRTMTPSTRLEFTDRLRGEAQRMAFLVEDVLELVRLELGRYLLDVRAVNLNELVRAAIESSRPQAESKAISIETSLDRSLQEQRLDANMINQALRNLLRNAIRFSPPKGRVAISTWLRDDGVMIELRDTGPAVAPEWSAAIFELDAAVNEECKRCEDGLGLGLHLAKRLVELHGGTIAAGVDPASGGALFGIFLPAGEGISPILGDGGFAEDLVRG